MPTLKSLKDSILSECEEDYVGLWSIIRDFEEVFPTQHEAAIREQVISVLQELLRANEIHAGYPTLDGHFRPLREPPDEVLARIEADWPYGKRPTIGEGIWFTRALHTTVDDISM